MNGTIDIINPTLTFPPFVLFKVEEGKGIGFVELAIVYQPHSFLSMVYCPMAEEVCTYIPGSEIVNILPRS